MKNALTKKWGRFTLVILSLVLPGVATAQLSFNHIVVFGTSLSDPGNAFTLLAHPVPGLELDSNTSQNTPPYDTLDESLIPSAPYAGGGHHFSNGATWIEQFAQGKGLSADVKPAFQSDSPKAHNYAVGGARATDYPNRVNLPQQVQAFLDNVGGVAPSDTLYVIEIGNNDLRDALVAFLTTLTTGGTLTEAQSAASNVIGNALNGIGNNIYALYLAGARKFLVWNTARLDLVPAVTALDPQVAGIAGMLANGFNQGLAQSVLVPLSGLPEIQIAQLDITQKMTDIFGSPNDYGITNNTDPCVTPNTSPFTCQQPSSYFFWDGIHPTKTVHGIISQFAADILAQYQNP